MTAIFALLLGVAFSAPIDKYEPRHSWDREFTTTEFKKEDPKKLFADWMKSFEVYYPSFEEEAYRYNNWFTAMQKIIHVNDQGLTYKLRMNQFGDLTDHEFKLRIHGHNGSCLQIPKLETLVEPQDDFNADEPFQAPAAVDWEASGDVTPVKNQRSCGSCWAFASTGALECDYSINKGTLNSLSEQQLVDCSRSYGNYGCNGGWWYNAFNYVKDEGGLCLESEYKYIGHDTPCKDKECGPKYNPITGDVKVTPDSDTALGNAVAIGCNAVGVEADQTSFQYYSSGVLTGTCGTSVDHGVLVVGYGISGSQQYWKVKNSWSFTWGDRGYIYICRNCGKNGDKGECGINMYPYYVNN